MCLFNNPKQSFPEAEVSNLQNDLQDELNSFEECIDLVEEAGLPGLPVSMKFADELRTAMFSALMVHPQVDNLKDLGLDRLELQLDLLAEKNSCRILTVAEFRALRDLFHEASHSIPFLDSVDSERVSGFIEDIRKPYLSTLVNLSNRFDLEYNMIAEEGVVLFKMNASDQTDFTLAVVTESSRFFVAYNDFFSFDLPANKIEGFLGFIEKHGLDSVTTLSYLYAAIGRHQQNLLAKPLNELLVIEFSAEDLKILQNAIEAYSQRVNFTDQIESLEDTLYISPAGQECVFDNTERKVIFQALQEYIAQIAFSEDGIHNSMSLLSKIAN